MQTLELGKIKKTTEKAAKEYPLLDTPEVSGLAGEIIEEGEQLKALDGSLKAKKATLTDMVRTFYYTSNQGRHEPFSSVEVKNCSRSLLVTFQNRYSSVVPDTLESTIGKDQTENLFGYFFELKIDGSKIPQASAQECVNKVIEVLNRYGAGEAISAKEKVAPKKDFHLARHILFTPEENIRLDEMVRGVVSMKVR